MKKENLIVLVGPTAVGKTDMSIELAQSFNGEIISGDSMQVYRGMDIGTAKVSKEEQRGIPHHLIDIKEPTEPFSVQEFQQRATKLIEEIGSRKKRPFLVGGTGLYVSSVIYDYQFSEVEEDNTYRQELEVFAKKYGNVALHEQLNEVDPKSYEQIHPNNVRRVIRALEIYHITGEPFGERGQQPPISPYNVSLIGLTMEREKLYERIDLRVDIMMEQGLLNEAERLYEAGVRNCQSVQAIGYKELYEYLDGKVTLEEAVTTLKQNSRRYAKRQLTWFRNKMDITWFDVTQEKDKMLQEIHQFVEGKLL